MKGSNQIILNQLTMIDALQHYFQTVVFKEGKVPKVLSVNSEKKSQSYAPDIENFSILIQEIIEEKPDAAPAV